MFQAKAKLSVRFGSEKLNTEKVIEKTKICIPAMLKPWSASSFCLPNKNRVGVARGDGTNLEVVYKTVVSDRVLTLYRPCAYGGAVL